MIYQKLSAVVVEDVDYERRAMVEFLKINCSNWATIIGSAGTCRSAFDLIQRTRPDILFLDIELGAFTCFDLLEMLEADGIISTVVFITDHDASNYIHKTHQTQGTVLGYIRKNDREKIMIDRLREVERRLFNTSLKKPYYLLKHAMNREMHEQISQRIVLDLGNREQSRIKLSNILYFEADGTATKIHLVRGKSLYSTKNLGEHMAKHEKTNFFVSPHRSLYVNLLHVALLPQPIRKTLLKTVTLSTGKELQLSTSKRDNFLVALDKFRAKFPLRRSL